MKVLAWGRAGMGLMGVFLAAVGITALPLRLCWIVILLDIAPRSHWDNSVTHLHLFLQVGVGMVLVILASQIFKRLPSSACEIPRKFLHVGIVLVGSWLGLIFAIVIIRSLLMIHFLHYENSPWQFWMSVGVGLATALLLIDRAGMIARYLLATRPTNIVAIPL